MKKLTSLASAITLIATLATPALAADNAFTDIDQATGDAKPYILKAQQYQLISGYPDGSFHPKSPISRQEIAAILERIVKPQFQFTANSPFRDVVPEDWAAYAIEAVNSAGVMRGDGDKIFRPQSQITRQELALLLARASGGHAEAPGGNLVVADRNQVAVWAQYAVETMLHLGWMKTDSDSRFRPTEPATREEVALAVTIFAGSTEATGRLLTPDGQPIAAAELTVMPSRKLDTRLARHVTTDESGQYKLFGLQNSEEYRIEAVLPENAPYAMPVFPKFVYQNTQMTLPDLKTLQPNITGVVYAPDGKTVLKNAELFAFHLDLNYETFYPYMHPNADGVFHLSLPEGGVFLTQHHRSGQFADGRERADVEVKNGIATPARFELHAAAPQLSGTVLDETGHPVEEAQIQLSNTSGRKERSTYSGADGGFSIDHLDSGTYEISISPAYGIPEYNTYKATFQIDNSQTRILAPTTLNWDRTPPEIHIRTTGTIHPGTTIEVDSNETGKIYLVPASAVVSDLLSLEDQISQGARYQNITWNSIAKLDTTGLTPGEYKIYAVDQSTFVSAPQTITIQP